MKVLNSMMFISILAITGCSTVDLRPSYLAHDSVDHKDEKAEKIAQAVKDTLDS